MQTRSERFELRAAIEHGVARTVDEFQPQRVESRNYSEDGQGPDLAGPLQPRYTEGNARQGLVGPQKPQNETCGGTASAFGGDHNEHRTPMPVRSSETGGPEDDDTPCSFVPCTLGDEGAGVEESAKCLTESPVLGGLDGDFCSSTFASSDCSAVPCTADSDLEVQDSAAGCFLGSQSLAAPTGVSIRMPNGAGCTTVRLLEGESTPAILVACGPWSELQLRRRRHRPAAACGHRMTCNVAAWIIGSSMSDAAQHLGRAPTLLHCFAARRRDEASANQTSDGKPAKGWLETAVLGGAPYVLHPASVELELVQDDGVPPMANKAQGGPSDQRRAVAAATPLCCQAEDESTPPIFLQAPRRQGARTELPADKVSCLLCLRQMSEVGASAVLAGMRDGALLKWVIPSGPTFASFTKQRRRSTKALHFEATELPESPSNAAAAEKTGGAILELREVPSTAACVAGLYRSGGAAVWDVSTAQLLEVYEPTSAMGPRILSLAPVSLHRSLPTASAPGVGLLACLAVLEGPEQGLGDLSSPVQSGELASGAQKVCAAALFGGWLREGEAPPWPTSAAGKPSALAVFGNVAVFGSRAGELVVGSLAKGRCGVLAISSIDPGSPLESLDAQGGVLAAACSSGHISLQRLLL